MSVLAQQQAAQQSYFVSMRSKHINLIDEWDKMETLATRKYVAPLDSTNRAATDYRPITKLTATTTLHT